MMRFILCEGKTDAILLSYYLNKTMGWKYDRFPKKFKINIPETENKYIGHYKKDGEELVICAVGGKDNFVNFYKENIEKYMVDSETDNLQYRLAIVIDKDDRSTKEIETYFLKNLTPYISTFYDGKWTSCTFLNLFNQESVIHTLGVVIPRDKQGALENLLMDAISEDKYRGNLIDKSKKFVDEVFPEATKIITTERLKLKTKLGVSLAILYPEKVFSLIDEQLNSISWEQSKTLNECFMQLKDI